MFPAHAQPAILRIWQEAHDSCLDECVDSMQTAEMKRTQIKQYVYTLLWVKLIICYIGAL